MWICPTCGEPHQDQFKECWKCIGDEMPQPGDDAAPPLASAKAERPLRPVSSIFFRMIVGFGVSMLLAVAVFQRRGIGLAEASMAGAFIGTGISLLVGFIFWVLLPFQPAAPSSERPEPGHSTSSREREQPEDDSFQ